MLISVGLPCSVLVAFLLLLFVASKHLALAPVRDALATRHTRLCDLVCSLTSLGCDPLTCVPGMRLKVPDASLRTELICVTPAIETAGFGVSFPAPPPM